jgi:hypothetical protein
MSHGVEVDVPRSYFVRLYFLMAVCNGRATTGAHLATLSGTLSMEIACTPSSKDCGSGWVSESVGLGWVHGNRPLDKRKLHFEFVKGHIVLLRKQKGDQQKFKSRRPITLLNVIYKIVAKAYQTRLAQVLTSLISPQQTACVQGRNIHHGIFTSECLHYAELSGLDHIIAKLDINKAYHRVEWEYLVQYLIKIGFGPNFVVLLKRPLRMQPQQSE